MRPPDGSALTLDPALWGRYTLASLPLPCDDPRVEKWRQEDYLPFPLHWAAQNGHAALVERLVAGGADVLEFGRLEINPRAYLSWFNFRGADQQKKVGVLSGGERNRLHLAKLLKEGGNVMLLDEPTNDLDVDTLRALEDAILRFAGCVLVISHDRWFLDRIATHILAFEGDSHVEWFAGNYEDYEVDRRQRYGDEQSPHRIKFKPVVRN